MTEAAVGLEAFCILQVDHGPRSLGPSAESQFLLSRNSAHMALI